jgi:hypothetical protein
MSKKDFLPAKYVLLAVWFNTFANKIVHDLERFGIPTDDFVALRDKISAFMSAQEQAVKANAGRTDKLDRAKKATAAKKHTRQFVNTFLRFNPAVTDNDRSDLGLTIPDPEPSPAPPIDTEPVGKVDFSVHQQHTLEVKDSHQSGRAKPDHAKGFEVWHKFGTPPEHDGDFQYTGFSSKDRMKIDYPLDMVGQLVFYRFRWINTRNVPGPWSEVVSAIIA